MIRSQNNWYPLSELDMKSTILTDINEYHSVWYPFDENPMLWLPIFMIVIVLIMMVAWQMADILVRRVKNGKKNMEGSDENN